MPPNAGAGVCVCTTRCFIHLARFDLYGLMYNVCIEVVQPLVLIGKDKFLVLVFCAIPKDVH